MKYRLKKKLGIIVIDIRVERRGHDNVILINLLHLIVYVGGTEWNSLVLF